MKNQDQNQERVQFPQSKPFIIKFINLQFFVVCLLVFSCGIAIGAAFFSSFPENLMILTLKLHSNSSNFVPFPVPTASNDHHNDRLTQHFSNPDNASDANHYSQAEKPVSSSHTQANFANVMGDKKVMVEPAMSSRTQKPSAYRPVSSYGQANFAPLDEKVSTTKAPMVSRTRDEPFERVPNVESQTKMPVISNTQVNFAHDKENKELATKAAMPLERAPNADLQPKDPIRGDFLHGMDDKELITKAVMVSRDRVDQLQMVPKVAFMFLVKGPMHLVPLWERFFRGNQGLFSIYVHSSPSYTDTFPDDSVFHGRRIPSKEVRWGKFNMVEAERRLIANALLDTTNQRFVLLSESCTPLFNFSTVYSYLINSNETFVEAYDLPGPVGRDRYSNRMRPVMTISQWRKGSQWFQIDRALALEVVLDNKYFWVFKRFCKGSCYADEHYLPTFVNIEFGERNSNRTLTWVDWSRGGPHPGRFERPFVTVEFLERLRNNRGCKYNGSGGNICFLFARKFPPSSVIRLMLFAAKVLKIQ